MNQRMLGLGRPVTRPTGLRLLTAAVVAVAARHIVGLVQLRSTLAWLGRAGHSARSERRDAPGIDFVVPVLNEQEHVPAMIEWFSQLLDQTPGSTLTVVSTERETRERRPRRRHVTSSGTAATSTTAEVIAAVLAGSRWNDRIQHLHYQGDGRKAAQVNHAADHLARATSPGSTTPRYVAVYDVDSRPTSQLVEATLELVATRQRHTGVWPAVVQQSARFTVTQPHPVGWQRSICRGAATLQTLWTLRREVPSFRRYARHTAPGRRTWDWTATARRGLAQTVGHGLLVRLDVLQGVGGFPTYTVLDDFPFGYRLSVLGVDVTPLPALTTVPAADSVAQLLAQGQRWFYNYLDYPECARRARSDDAGDRWSRGVALTVGLYRGLTWLLRSAGAASVVLAVTPRVDAMTRVTAGIALLAGTVVPVAALRRTEGRSLRPGDLVAESAELWVASLTSCTGPMLAIAQWATLGRPGAAISPKADRTAPSRSRFDAAGPTPRPTANGIANRAEAW